LPELVCEGADDYVRRAITLASNRQDIQAYKARLEAGRDRCVLFDTGLLTHRLEELYRSMCADYVKGDLPRPDLNNLSAYHDVSVSEDHEASEFVGLTDYHGWYKAKLAQRHSARPMPPDARLWTAADIAALDEWGQERDTTPALPEPRRKRQAVG
jgi:hypothetical protein